MKITGFSMHQGLRTPELRNKSQKQTNQWSIFSQSEFDLCVLAEECVVMLLMKLHEPLSSIKAYRVKTLLCKFGSNEHKAANAKYRRGERGAVADQS